MFTMPMSRTILTWAALLLLSTGGPVRADVSFDDVIAWLETYRQAPSDGLAPGTYGADADLSAYIAPGLIEVFDFPEFELELTETLTYQPHSSYREATAQYIDTATIAANGALDSYVSGLPFSPQAIANAPVNDAGSMVVWNHIYRWQHYGYKSEIMMNYVQPAAPGTAGRKTDGIGGGGDVRRHVTMYYHRVYLSGLAMLKDQGYRVDVDDSDSVHWKEYVKLLDPFDVKGTQFVVERPIDPELGDQVNSYLPTERRVRRLSAKERADHWMGSAFTFDEFEGFSARPLDYQWTYRGRKVVLHVNASKHEAAEFYGPASNVPIDRWQLRPCYVVEGFPKWDGHPYGRRLVFFDANTFSTALHLIFDREDRLLYVFYTVYRQDTDGSDPATLPDLTVPRWRASVGINIQGVTTSIARGSGAGSYATITPAKVRRVFDVSNLTSGR